MLIMEVFLVISSLISHVCMYSLLCTSFYTLVHLITMETLICEDVY